MPEFANFTEQSVQLAALSPGVTLEFDGPSDYDEKTRRDHMENVTAQAIVVTDALLRGRDGANPIHSRMARIYESLKEEGHNKPEHRPARYARDEGIIGLYRLSAQMTRALLHPEDTQYTIGGCGTPYGGYTATGEPAASESYDYGGPLGTGGHEESHWFKKGIQIILHGTRSFTIGVYAPGQQQLTLERFETELADPDFAAFLGKQPDIRIAEKQPIIIPDLKTNYESMRIEKTDLGGIRLPGFADIMRDATSRYGFEYTAFTPREPSVYGASALATLMHSHEAMGLQFRISAHQGYGDDKKPIAFECNPDKDEYRVKDVEGKQPALESVDLSSSVMVSSNHRGWSTAVRQEECVYPEYLRESAVAFTSVLQEIHQNLVPKDGSGSGAQKV